MASYPRDGYFRLHRTTTTTRGSGNREPVPEGLPAQRLLDRLVADLQSHLDEMEEMRALLADAYPRLSGRRERRAAAAAAAARPDRDEHDASHYRFSFDVAGFAPEELAAKLDGKKLTLTGTHTRRTEAPDGRVSHEFREVRKELALPEDADLDALACNFAPETGRLLVEAPRLAPLPAAAAESPVSIPILREPAAADAAAPGSLPAGKDTPPASPEKGAAASD